MSRARWNALAKNLAASRQINGFFEVWPVGPFFPFSLMGIALVFTKKSKNHRTRNASQSQDGGFLEDLFAVCPETWVALDKANFVTFFSEVWQKCTKFVLVQPGPYSCLVVFHTLSHIFSYFSLYVLFFVWLYPLAVYTLHPSPGLIILFSFVYNSFIFVLPSVPVFVHIYGLALVAQQP